MKLSFMSQLVLVLGLYGALARKPSNQPEVSVVTDDGFSAGSLAQIETSILSLANDRSSADADNSTLESLAIIQSFLNTMKQDVVTRANATQSGVNQSWHNLVNCKLNLTASPTQNLTVLSTIHRECSEQESSLLSSHSNCTGNCDETCATAQATCGLYCPVNTPQPMPGPPVPSPTPSPTSCWYDQTQLKNVDEAGIYHEWESNLYYKKFEDAFSALYDDWKAKRDDCHGKVTSMNSCYNSCDNGQGNSYSAKKQECTDHQHDLEAAACHGSSSSCDAYQSCFRSLTNIYKEDVDSANASQSNWYHEYRGIMRVECLLDAFKASIVAGSDLSTALNACQSQTFYPCTAEPSLCLEFYPLPNEEDCNGTYANTTLQPGSTEWIDTYYLNMPVGTTYEQCGAACCVPSSLTTTTTTATPSSHNCTLCCTDTDDWCLR